MINNKTKNKLITLLSFLGFSLVVAQIIYLVATGNNLCPTQGCEIVESLVKVPPLWFNILGASFFLLVFVLSLLASKLKGSETLLNMILLAALAAEGVLLSYQIFVVSVFCFYCLCVFFFVLCLNLLSGWRQIITAVAAFGAVLLMFSILEFNHNKSELSLSDGTYAIKDCAESQKELYFIFGEDCPHCHRVIEILQSCTECKIFFNPVTRVKNEPLAGLTKTDEYQPEINIELLKLLDINTIPVLIDRGRAGARFIRGDENIINYLKVHCFSLHGAGVEDKPAEVPATTTLSNGECSIDTGCADEQDSGKGLWQF